MHMCMCMHMHMHMSYAYAYVKTYDICNDVECHRLQAGGTRLQGGCLRLPTVAGWVAGRAAHQARERAAALQRDEQLHLGVITRELRRVPPPQHWRVSIRMIGVVARHGVAMSASSIEHQHQHRRRYRHRLER